MSDVFISYANSDRPVAQQLADALEALGWSVWWDREIPLGKAFDQVIEEELNAAQCVIVLWSEASARSRWVKTEAAAAAERDRLLPILIEDVPIPFEFKRIQTARLFGWNGDRTHPVFLQVLDSLRRMLGQATVDKGGEPAPSRPPGVPPSRPAGWGTRAAAGGLVLVVLIGFATWRMRSDAVDSAAPRTPSSGPGATPAAPSVPATASTAPRASTTPARGSASNGAGASSRSERDPIAAAAPAVTPVKGAFVVKIGDRIEEGVPAAGAGTIESPGARDVYTFAAAAGQRVYFRMLQHAQGMNLIQWNVVDPDGAPVFETRLGYSEPGVHVLKKAGTYTMTVGSDREPAVGVYRLQLFNVPPPQRFTIKIGDVITDNVPGQGAGLIETPGAKDVYTFTAQPGERVYFRMFEHATGMNLIKWTLVDSEGTVVFDTRLGYSEPGVQVLRKGGTYTMTVGSDREAATGTYRLQLTSVQ